MVDDAQAAWAHIVDGRHVEPKRAVPQKVRKSRALFYHISEDGKCHKIAQQIQATILLKLSCYGTQ